LSSKELHNLSTQLNKNINKFKLWNIEIVE
jgi:hypothetical protein